MRFVVLAWCLSCFSSKSPISLPSSLSTTAAILVGSKRPHHGCGTARQVPAGTMEAGKDNSDRAHQCPQTAARHSNKPARGPPARANAYLGGHQRSSKGKLYSSCPAHILTLTFQSVNTLPELLSLFFCNTTDMLLDHLLAAPCQFIKEEPGYTIRNALVSILRLAIGEPMPDRLVSILLNVIEVLRFLVFLFSHQLLFCFRTTTTSAPQMHFSCCRQFSEMMQKNTRPKT